MYTVSKKYLNIFFWLLWVLQKKQISLFISFKNKNTWIFISLKSFTNPSHVEKENIELVKHIHLNCVQINLISASTIHQSVQFWGTCFENNLCKSTVVHFQLKLIMILELLHSEL